MQPPVPLLVTHGKPSTRDCPFQAVFVTQSRGKACFHQMLLCQWITREPWTVTASLLFSSVFKNLLWGFLDPFVILIVWMPHLSQGIQQPVPSQIHHIPASAPQEQGKMLDFGIKSILQLLSPFCSVFLLLSLPFTLEKWLSTLA